MNFKKNKIAIPNSIISERVLFKDKSFLYLLFQCILNSNIFLELLLSKSSVNFLMDNSNKRYKSDYADRALELFEHYDILSNKDIKLFNEGHTISASIDGVYQKASDKKEHSKDRTNFKNYTLIPYSDFLKIKDIKNKQTKYNALNLYFYLFFRTYVNTTCSVTYSEIMKNVNVSRPTTTSTINRLVELGLILYGNDGLFFDEKEKHVKKYNNHYAIVSKCGGIDKAKIELRRKIRYISKEQGI